MQRLTNERLAPIDRLVQAERNIELLSRDVSARLRPFRQIGRWLLSEETLENLFTSGQTHWLARQFSISSRLRALMLTARSRMAEKLNLSSRADGILFKSNLRAFYPAQFLTIKLANPTRLGSECRIENEKKVRERIVGTEGIGIPRITNITNFPFRGVLVEELLDAQRINAHSVGSSRLARHLLDFYKANGISFRPLFMAGDLKAAWSTLVDYCRVERISISKTTHAIMKDLISPDSDRQLVAWTVCNGDLSSTNILQNSSRFYIVDWEWVREAPLFFDVARLSCQIRGFAKEFLTVVASDLNAKDADRLDVSNQFALSIVSTAYSRILRQDDFVSTSEKAFYRRKLRDKIRSLVALLERTLIGSFK